MKASAVISAFLMAFVMGLATTAMVGGFVSLLAGLILWPVWDVVIVRTFPIGPISYWQGVVAIFFVYLFGGLLTSNSSKD